MDKSAEQINWIKRAYEYAGTKSETVKEAILWAAFQQAEREKTKLLNYTKNARWFGGCPEKEGFYWLIDGKNGELQIVRYDGKNYRNIDSFTVMGYDGGVEINHYKNPKWLGPIEPQIENRKSKIINRKSNRVT